MSKRKFFIAALFPLWGLGGFAQTPPITIKWTTALNGEHYLLDSVIVTNKTNDEKAVFRYPDTVLVCGDSDLGIKQLAVTRNTLRVFPNPFSHTTQVEFSLARGGEADLAVYDVLGREVLRKVSVLESGTHSFKLSLPSGFYTLRLQTAEGVRTARVVSEGKESPACLNHDFNKACTERSECIKKIFKISPANPENLTIIMVQDKKNDAV